MSTSPGMRIRINADTLLRTDNYNFKIANQSGKYTHHPRQMLDVIQMRGFASDAELSDMHWFVKAVERCESRIRALYDLRYDQFDRIFESPIGTLGCIGRNRLNIYDLHLALPWRKEMDRCHERLNFLLVDLLLFAIRRSRCTSFAAAVAHAVRVTDEIVDWRQQLDAPPIKKARLVGVTRHDLDKDAPRLATTEKTP